MSGNLDDLRSALDTPAQPAGAPIDRDLPCQGCGYNLRGVAENAKCPECGTPAGASLHGDRLAWAHPQWLAAVRSGLLQMSMGIILILPVFLVIGTAVNLLQPSAPLRVIIILAPLVGCAALFCIGAFRLTSPEPRLAQDELPVTPRRLIRISSVLVSLVAAAYTLFVAGPAVADDHGNVDVDPVIKNILELGFLLIPVMLYGTLAHLRQFARRIPDPTLVTSTNVVITGLPLSIVAIIATPAPPRGEPLAIHYLVYFAAIFFMVWLVVLIRQFSTALDSPADAALRNRRRAGM